MKKTLFGFVSLFALLLFMTACDNGAEIEGTLTLEPDSAVFTTNGGTKSIILAASTSWNVVIPEGAGWCTITPTSGKGTGVLRVAAEVNPMALERTVDVAIHCDGKIFILPVRQEAANVSSDYAEGDVRIYQINRQTNPVNMVFLGDGFLAEDYSNGGAFDKAVAEAAEAIFNVEPYKTYREYFNIYKVAAFSQQRGATYKDKNITKNTTFSTAYIGGSGMETDDKKVFLYAQKVPNLDVEESSVILIVNDSRYAGTTMLYSSGRSIAICPMNRSTQLPGGFGHIVVHEAGGHGFGQLADEYTNDVQTPPTADETKELKQWFDFGFYRNVDLTGDPANVKWNTFIGRPGYEAVSTYEGANYHEVGVWRPEKLSCMDNNIYYFNAPSRAAIVARLLKAAKENFNMESFVTKDIGKSLPPALATRAQEDNSLPRLAPPVLIDNR